MHLRHWEKMSTRGAYILSSFMVLLFVVVAPPTAWSLTWSGGGAAGSSDWSSGANWAGAPPSLSEPFGLEFPRLLNPTCTSAPPSDTCYVSKNDVGDVAVESLRVDDGDEYELEGDGITLGSEGLAAAPASGSGGPAGDYVGLPIELAASQAWSVAGRSGGGIGENGLFMEGALTGPGKSLAVNIENGAALYLHNSTQVGPLTFAGANTGEVGANNGFVGLLGAQVNSSDGDGVTLSHILMVGSGSVGALTLSDAGLGVGSGHPAGGIGMPSATLDASSEVQFEITGTGTVADIDYGQLSSDGTVALGSSTMGVFVAPTSGTNCPVPSPGQRYAFVSATGTLSGSFGNAPEGTEIPVSFSQSCAQRPSVHLRIAYHRSEGTETVTGTVPGGTELSEPEQKYNPYERPNAEGAVWGPIAAARDIEESTARERAAEAAARQREEAERLARAAHTSVSLVSTALVAQHGAIALAELTCVGSASETCAGKLVLSVRLPARKGKRSHTPVVGTASFSVAAGKTTSVRIRLNATGRALMRKAHGRLNASLAILQSAPASHSQLRSVHLLARRSPRVSRSGS